METVAIPQAGFAAPRGLRLCSSPPPPVSRCIWTGFGVLLHVEPVTTFFFAPCSAAGHLQAPHLQKTSEPRCGRPQVNRVAHQSRSSFLHSSLSPGGGTAFLSLPAVPSQADATMTNDSNQIGHLQAQLSNLGC